MKTNSNISKSYSSKKYDDLLKSFKCSKGDNILNTRIGDKELNIYGGCYNIKYTNEFWELYNDHVFVNNNYEYLTEKQLLENGPLLIDIDLRYNSNIKKRQHNKTHILDIIILYLNKLNEIFDIDDKSNIFAYVSEKPEVNLLDNKTKDGIHIVFTIKMNKSEQLVLRKKILNELENIFESLPIVNSYEDIIDEGIAKGFVNWQLFGSRKPGNKAYNLSYYYSLIYNKDDDIWDIKEKNISKDELIKHLPIMSARYDNHIRFSLKNNKTLLEAIQEQENNLNHKDKKPKANIINNNIDFEYFDYKKIKNDNDLNNLVEVFLNNLSNNDYELKETHLYAMILPENYYGEGSYNKWIRVGWALKNTNEKMFLSWIKLSSQSKTFDYSDIPEYYNMWKSFETRNSDKLTSRSIMFWAKTDNFIKYQEIRQETISYYIDLTLESIINKDKIGEFDLANVLFQLYKDQFVCVSIKNNQWYEYKDYKWHEIDSGNSLRLLISKKMHDIYIRKAHDLIETITKLENNEQNADPLKLKSSKLGDICILLKTTTCKNNIMKEAKELFYDKDFLNKLDANPYLLCFNNYVVDIKEKSYRKGRPDDFISKSTNIEYIPYKDLNGPSKFNKSIKYEKIIKEINLFMKELFPDEELRRYMWEHLASTIVGTNENQTFNIYNGSGANGKSKLVELMGKSLGDYKATVPVTLITQKRTSIGSTSSEIVQLQGVRYAVMQEPSKGDKINEGIMKEITGGDPIQGRALFKETITFIPQFKLVVCTNVLFEIPTNDDGTWRRIRLCDFMSKFIDEPYKNDKFPKQNFPYQYQVDRKIDEKFEYWCPVFMSMLINLAFETQGYVKDAKIVLSISDKYRQNQDYLTEFAKEKIIKRADGKIKKTEILEEFKNWFIMHYGRNNLPNGKEITDYMDKNYGKSYRGKWSNVEINYDDESDYEED
jgi:P4 family phage/plasmid primase-like protien